MARRGNAPQFSDGQKGNLRKERCEFPAVHVSHGKDVFQNRAVFDKSARPVAAYLIPLVVGEDRHAVLILAGFPLCLRKVTAEFG